MTDTPAERPARRRQDPGSADVETQVDLGWVEPQPEPELPAPPDPVEQPEP
ncbi:hypothetical protein [Streptomyces zaomyceticus]|uniref:hypothetical protein n=1 Tax=Streptomyces zaomyceticus TaxID=68286 RepID=UPI002E134697|nr:hypothetical protein OG237_16005 [Streptomyces zaomyceticus]